MGSGGMWGIGRIVGKIIERGFMGTVVMGVDPGFHVTGFAIMCSDGSRSQVLDCGFLKMKSSQSLSQRVGLFYSFFKEKIIQHNVTEIALETSFLGKNAQTFLKLGFLRGILLLLVDQYSLSLHEFAPREVKIALTGFGGASKEQVATMVLRFFPSLRAYGPTAQADVTDALAITLCGLWRYGAQAGRA
jgi:crossover junction endodeoxyribonuclease RuvC